MLIDTIPSFFLLNAKEGGGICSLDTSIGLMPTSGGVGGSLVAKEHFLDGSKLSGSQFLHKASSHVSKCSQNKTKQSCPYL